MVIVIVIVIEGGGAGEFVGRSNAILTSKGIKMIKSGLRKYTKVKVQQ